jgi:hypothetical protein
MGLHVVNHGLHIVNCAGSSSCLRRDNLAVKGGPNPGGFAVIDPMILSVMDSIPNPPTHGIVKV